MSSGKGLSRTSDPKVVVTRPRVRQLLAMSDLCGPRGSHRTASHRWQELLEEKAVVASTRVGAAVPVALAAESGGLTPGKGITRDGRASSRAPGTMGMWAPLLCRTVRALRGRQSHCTGSRNVARLGWVVSA